MTVSGCAVSGNTALQGEGGGISTDGFMTLRNSSVTGNSAASGGGLVNTDTVTISGSSFTGNTATGLTLGVARGGAILNSQNMAIRDCAFTGNSASQGGAIYNDAPYVLTLTVSGSTFTGNTAADSTTPAAPRSNKAPCPATPPGPTAAASSTPRWGRSGYKTAP